MKEYLHLLVLNLGTSVDEAFLIDFLLVEIRIKNIEFMFSILHVFKELSAKVFSVLEIMFPLKVSEDFPCRICPWHI